MAKQTARAKSDSIPTPVDYDLIKRQILALYLVQTLPRQICEMLNVTRPLVQSVIHEESRRRRLDEEEEIVCLYREGKELEEIAEHLQLRLSVVRGRVNQLIDAGFLEAREPKRGRTRAERSPDIIPLRGPESDLYDLEEPRVRLVLALMRQRATLEQIGEALGVTRQRAERIQKEILEIHGPEVVGTPEVLTLREAAEKIGLTLIKLRKIAEDAGLELSQGERHNNLVSPEILEQLREAHTTSQQGTCVICKRPFVRTNKRSQACKSRECRETLRDQRRAQLISTPAAGEELHGWHAKLFQALEQTALKKSENWGEEWIGLAEAAEISKLTKVQLWWLAKRQIVSTRVSPRKARWEKTTLYARRQVLLAGRVYREFQEAKKKSST